MFGIGMPQLVIILAIVLLVFGAGRLPEVGRALGQSIRNFKTGSEDNDDLDSDGKGKTG